MARAATSAETAIADDLSELSGALAAVAIDATRPACTHPRGLVTLPELFACICSLKGPRRLLIHRPHCKCRWRPRGAKLNDFACQHDPEVKRWETSDLCNGFCSIPCEGEYAFADDSFLLLERTLKTKLDAAGIGAIEPRMAVCMLDEKATTGVLAALGARDAVERYAAKLNTRRLPYHLGKRYMFALSRRQIVPLLKKSTDPKNKTPCILGSELAAIGCIPDCGMLADPHAKVHLGHHTDVLLQPPVWSSASDLVARAAEADGGGAGAHAAAAEPETVMLVRLRLYNKSELKIEVAGGKRMLAELSRDAAEREAQEEMHFDAADAEVFSQGMFKRKDSEFTVVYKVGEHAGVHTGTSSSAMSGGGGAASR